MFKIVDQEVQNNIEEITGTFFKTLIHILVKNVTVQ